MHGPISRTTVDVDSIFLPAGVSFLEDSWQYEFSWRGASYCRPVASAHISTMKGRTRSAACPVTRPGKTSNERRAFLSFTRRDTGNKRRVINFIHSSHSIPFTGQRTPGFVFCRISSECREIRVALLIELLAGRDQRISVSKLEILLRASLAHV